MFASSKIRDCSKVSQTKLQRSSIQPQAGSLQWNYSPVILTPQLCDSKGSHELTSDSALCDIMEDEDMPEILKDTSTPLKVVKASSPNQKQVMPPHYRSDSQRSSSPHGMRSVRKFILQTMPPFPPLTPYSNSKGRVNQKENDQKDNIGNHWFDCMELVSLSRICCVGNAIDYWIWALPPTTPKKKAHYNVQAIYCFCRHWLVNCFELYECSWTQPLYW